MPIHEHEPRCFGSFDHATEVRVVNEAPVLVHDLLAFKESPPLGPAGEVVHAIAPERKRPPPAGFADVVLTVVAFTAVAAVGGNVVVGAHLLLAPFDGSRQQPFNIGPAFSAFNGKNFHNCSCSGNI